MKALIRAILLCLIPLAAVADVSQWSTTPSSNTASPPFGAPEGMAPSAVNDVMRQIMADVRVQLEDGEWLNWGHVPTRVDNDTFTVPTDLTAVYHTGRRIKATGSATGYASISSSSYSSPNTTINVTMDTGNLPGTLSTVYVGVLSATNTSAPVDSRYLLSASGTIPDARLSANVALLNTSPTFGNGTLPIRVTSSSSDQFAIAARLGGGGAVYFGAGSSAASPNAQFSNNAGTIIATISDAGVFDAASDVKAAGVSVCRSNGTSCPVTATGTGASGTWGISVTGNAVTATSATSATTASTANALNASNSYTAVSFTATSDIRLKSNIQPISSAVDKLSGIHGITFAWKQDGSRSLGVAAQDVEQVFPEAVRTASDGTKSVNYDGLVGALIEANHELAARVAALEARP